MSISGPGSPSGLARRYSERISRDLEQNVREQEYVRTQSNPSTAELADLQDSHRFLTNLRRILDSSLRPPRSQA